MRHVPVTRRVAAWIAAAAHDPATSLKFVIGFAVAHALLWTIILTALKAAQDVHMDVAEAYAWGQKFLLGYGKHPPLAGWVAGVWFRIFPVTDWATYALAMTVAGIGLVICWLIAVRVVDHRRAMFTVAMLALYPVFTFKGFKYNPDLLQLVTLPLFVLAYLDAFQKRTWMSGVWLGLAAALALMTKYWVLTMIGAAGLAALIHPDRMRFLRSPAPWVAFVACLVGMLPHLWWLKQADFLPLIYADDVYGGRTFGTTLRLASIYLVHNLGLLLLPVGFAAIALAWKLQWWKSLRRRGLVGEFIVEACRTREVGLKHSERLIETMMRRRALFCTGKPSERRDKCAEKNCFKLCERIDRLKDELAQKTAESLEIKEKCEGTLALIPDRSDREVMSLYYIDGMTWRQIAKATHFSYSHIMTQRRAALAVLTAVLDDKEGSESSEDRN